MSCINNSTRKVTKRGLRCSGRTSYGNVRHASRYAKSTHATCVPIATTCVTGSRKRSSASTQASLPTTRRDSAAPATFAFTIKIVETSARKSWHKIKSKATMNVPNNLPLHPMRTKNLIKFRNEEPA